METFIYKNGQFAVGTDVPDSISLVTFIKDASNEVILKVYNSGVEGGSGIEAYTDGVGGTALAGIATSEDGYGAYAVGLGEDGVGLYAYGDASIGGKAIECDGDIDIAGKLKLEPKPLLATPELGKLEYTDDGVDGHLYFTLNVGSVVTRVQII